MGLDTKKLNLRRTISIRHQSVSRGWMSTSTPTFIFRPRKRPKGKERLRLSTGKHWQSKCRSTYAFCAQKKPDQILDDTEQVVFKPRLPAMFETLQDVLKTLVPEHNHPTVMQSLDVPLLMQQVEKGVLDLERLSEWLARILTMHCAPMRDEWANRMAEQIRAGLRMQDMEKIAIMDLRRCL
ncbi:T-complex protein 11 domain containing protein [Elaphomyces granulatus]